MSVRRSISFAMAEDEAYLIGRALDEYLDQHGGNHDEAVLAWQFAPDDLEAKATARVDGQVVHPMS